MGIHHKIGLYLLNEAIHVNETIESKGACIRYPHAGRYPHSKVTKNTFD